MTPARSSSPFPFAMCRQDLASLAARSIFWIILTDEGGEHLSLRRASLAVVMPLLVKLKEFVENSG